MRKKYSALAGVLLIATAVLVFAAPTPSSAVVINSVSAFSGGTNFILWNAGLPINLVPGVSNGLILVENPAGGGNFDTSDQCGVGTAGPSCAGLPAPSVTVNGQNFVDGTNASNVLGFNYSGGNPVDNESQQWKLIGISSGGDFEVFVGYADNSHTQPCPAGTPLCHPTGPWIGDPGVSNIGNVLSIFDTGAILIVPLRVVVPEPASLLLLGAGLVGLAAWSRKRLQNRV